MSDIPQTQPPGWYYAQGDPPGTHRWWDGTQWVGGPQPVPGAPQAGGVATVGGATMAEPLNRIGARFIDYILWVVVSLIINLIFLGGAVLGSGSRNGASYIVYVLSQFVVLALTAGYEVFLVGTRGATLGKMALGLKVVKEDGSAPDFQVAFMRVLPYVALGVAGAIIPVVGFLFGLIEFIILVVSLVFLFTDPKRQTVWDKIAKTMVVNAK